MDKAGPRIGSFSDCIMIRGKHQIGLSLLPSHGDRITDINGRKWTVKCEGGFKLRDGMECHPDFLNGPLDAVAFAEWFNSAL